jgi:hypothetical protein
MKMRTLVLFVLTAFCIARRCEPQDKLNVIRGSGPKQGVAPTRNRLALSGELETSVRKITGDSQQVVVTSDGPSGLRIIVLGNVSKDHIPDVISAVRKRTLDSDAEQMHLMLMANASDTDIREMIAEAEKGGTLPHRVYLSLRERIATSANATEKPEKAKEPEKGKPHKDRHNP